ncbi:VOC family protein [Allokutzneria albata]|uniref:Catechol 2,3-dioxygenase n=1 Tax=Allokutzneria albata TaxID=211114 RepID=A0A1G9SHX6_ALLAB|nr:VOC family protein [Allokutzneria albata]SDM35002.1 Catechol 2,3-dioxygenase [Allokutzneria albata]
MSTVRRLDHIGVVVEDLDAATEFFLGLGLEKAGAMSMRGDWIGGIIGLEDVHTDVVFVSAPDGTGKLELIKFHSPADDRGVREAAANRLGIRHLAFVVEDLDGVLGALAAKGATRIGKIHDHEGVVRLCYVRGPEGIIVELAEEIGS